MVLRTPLAKCMNGCTRPPYFGWTSVLCHNRYTVLVAHLAKHGKTLDKMGIVHPMETEVC